ncbi:MAG: hypothetical protein ACOC1F_00895, partial [Myxococcota bacterium]
MTKASTEEPTDDKTTETSDSEREARWRRVMEGLEAEPGRWAGSLERMQKELVRQRDAMSGLLDELGALLRQRSQPVAAWVEEIRVLRDESEQSAARVAALEDQVGGLGSRVDKAELEAAIAKEEVAALEERLEEARAWNRALEEEVAARKKEAADAKAAEKRAVAQLDENLDALTDLGLQKTELERRVADLEGSFEAVKEERAGAEERWNATDDQRLARIRELESRIEDLQSTNGKLRQERDD